MSCHVMLCRVVSGCVVLSCRVIASFVVPYLVLRVCAVFLKLCFV